MADELIDILDDQGNRTGEARWKSEAHALGLWHLSVQVWIYNSKGEVLLQKRAMSKEFFPGIWDLSATGHVAVSEDTFLSAVREIKEEVGLLVKEEDLEFFEIYKFAQNIRENLKNYEFAHVYFLRFDGDMGELKFQEEEIDEIRFISLETFKKDLLGENTKKMYVPHYDFFLKVISVLQDKIFSVNF